MNAASITIKILLYKERGSYKLLDFTTYYIILYVETWRFVNETCTVHKQLFQRKLTCVTLYHKDLKKYMLKKRYINP